MSNREAMLEKLADLDAQHAVAVADHVEVCNGTPHGAQE